MKLEEKIETHQTQVADTNFCNFQTKFIPPSQRPPHPKKENDKKINKKNKIKKLKKGGKKKKK